MLSDSLRVPIRLLAGNEDLPLPAYQTPHAAGLDLRAALTEPVVLEVAERRLFGCGFSIAVPVGYQAEIRPRSGLALKHGVTVINAPGTIDSDYRGEVCVALVNLGQEPFTVERGFRIAQMLITPLPRIEWQLLDELPDSERGAGGFGHTGT